MRPVVQRKSAAGVTPWVMMDRRQEDFQASLAVNLSATASLTYDVEFTLDKMGFEDIKTQFTLSRAATVLTVNFTAHGLNVNDFVKFQNCGAPFDGEYPVATVVDENNFTVTVANSGLTSLDNGLGQMLTARIFKHDTMVGKTTADTGNLDLPVCFTRLNVTTYAAGFAEFTVIMGGH